MAPKVRVASCRARQHHVGPRNLSRCPPTAGAEGGWLEESLLDCAFAACDVEQTGSGAGTLIPPRGLLLTPWCLFPPSEWHAEAGGRRRNTRGGLEPNGWMHGQPDGCARCPTDAGHVVSFASDGRRGASLAHCGVPAGRDGA